jgi:hypothetical protein
MTLETDFDPSAFDDDGDDWYTHQDTMTNEQFVLVGRTDLGNFRLYDRNGNVREVAPNDFIIRYERIS